MTLHTDTLRKAQRHYDAQLPSDDGEAFHAACDEVANRYDRSSETAELISVMVNAAPVIDFLISSVEVPAHLLYDLRALLNKQRSLSAQIDAEMRSPTYRDARLA
ncbi:hypothetical protein ACODUO_15060 [Stenotrophomonas maltophilia]